MGSHVENRNKLSVSDQDYPDVNHPDSDYPDYLDYQVNWRPLAAMLFGHRTSTHTHDNFDLARHGSSVGNQNPFEL